MERREFIRNAAVAGGAIALGGAALLGCDDSSKPEATPNGRLIDTQPSDSPIDHIVVVTMENRSFDHYLGWLNDDKAYFDAGRKRYGSRFTVDARNDLSFQNKDGVWVDTHHLANGPTESNPFRGCGHPVPNHGWVGGRRELNEGFIGAGTGNDEYALGYYNAADLPMTAHLARRFTVCDRSFPSLLGPTFPNRQYLHAATSEGRKGDPGPLKPGAFKATTIWEKLAAANVPRGYYYCDLTLLLLYGDQYKPITHPIDDYFDDCKRGTLPNVTYVEPKFGGEFRTDDHTDGDVRLGQRFIRDVFQAFVESKHWERGVFILTYDEWGGFFDHVQPPILQDGQRTQIYAPDTFQQTGFRIPTIVASPYGPRGGVDHTVYDHTSILRFIEWRFLGAPKTGPGKPGATPKWALNARDRHANNLGLALVDAKADVDVDFDLDVKIAPATTSCLLGAPPTTDPLLRQEDPFQVGEELLAKLEKEYPSASYAPEKLPGVIQDPEPTSP
jgi:phospholipase C